MKKLLLVLVCAVFFVGCSGTGVKKCITGNQYIVKNNNYFYSGLSCMR